MDIRHLQYIQEIVRLNSFTKAAETLHITQPSISKAVKQLEQELGTDLFIREGKHFRLTDAGSAILKYAGPILQLFESLQSELNDLNYLNQGSIRIGLPPMAGASFFPTVIKRFQDRYRGIAITMIEEGAVKIEEGLIDGTLDVGVVISPIKADIFDSFALIQDRLSLVVSPSHRLAGRDEVKLAELAEERFILFNRNFALHDQIIGRCRSVGFEPQIVHESSQWDFIAAMVGAELGIAMLPQTICQTLPAERIVVVPLVQPVIPWELVLVWKRDGYLSLATRAWISFTQEVFGGKPGE
ncbi:LysR family transcriptional regulator [Paenibacillus whitsoniae]|uniref:LysR family transcriptional regulator n=1 Tax=Paenibacillus whitsoniae TaxID=2496558 RepID=A0A3S0CCF8_9BACL|nr:LysR family transcriptional regulator [Paenibacillus whitsoniae]RTE10700.1 LysR family transcriptional regulator [Paenibacillus whitsoniae]